MLFGSMVFVSGTPHSYERARCLFVGKGSMCRRLRELEILEGTINGTLVEIERTTGFDGELSGSLRGEY